MEIIAYLVDVLGDIVTIYSIATIIEIIEGDC